jgi:hypothetical protein
MQEGELMNSEAGSGYAPQQDYEGGYAPQGGQQDWRANLPPDLQNSMQRFNSPEGLAKAYHEAMGLISKKVDSFSQQDWNTYANMRAETTGIPPSPDYYQIDMAPLREGSINTFSQDDVESLKEISHEMGLNNQQTQQLYGVLNELGNEILQHNEDYAQHYTVNNMNELAQDWGNACETKLRAVSNCVENILPQITGVSAERIKDEIMESGAHNSALLMKIFAALGELSSESSSYGYNNIAPMDAGMRLSQLKSDPEWSNAVVNKFHPMHRQAREELATLTRMKNGEY